MRPEYNGFHSRLSSLARKLRTKIYLSSRIICVVQLSKLTKFSLPLTNNLTGVCTELHYMQDVAIARLINCARVPKIPTEKTVNRDKYETTPEDNPQKSFFRYYPLSTLRSLSLFDFASLRLKTADDSAQYG